MNNILNADKTQSKSNICHVQIFAVAKVTYASVRNHISFLKDRKLNCKNWKTSPEFVEEEEKNFFGLHLLHITCLGSGEMKSQLQSPAYFPGFIFQWISSELKDAQASPAPTLSVRVSVGKSRWYF